MRVWKISLSLVFFGGITVGVTIWALVFESSPYDIIPNGTVLECKIQEDGKYFVVSEEGEVYRLELGDWALLNAPRCK